MKPAIALPLLGLAPLLGASDLLVKALGIALVALPLLSLFGLLLPVLRRALSGHALWFGALLLAGVLVGLAQLLMQAFAFELHRALGPFPALLALPCLLLLVASEPAGPGTGLRQGLLFATCALLLGALRELLGHASLLLHGEWLSLGALHWQAAADGLPLFASAPGGLILLGLLLALVRLKP